MIIREPADRFAHSVAEFQRVLGRAEILEASSAIICRAHQQLELIRGEVNYSDLKGITKDLALASFFRDCRKDYKRAYQLVESAIRSITGDHDIWGRVDDLPESKETLQVKLEIWRFVKNDSIGLPPVSLDGGQWISAIRQSLGELLTKLGFKDIPSLGNKIRKTGLDDNQLGLPLFEAHKLFPPIRQETIHQVKGESIDAVLVLGSVKFWNSVVDAVESGTNSEDRRLAYVAMTRARHLLAIGLPASHFDKHADKWERWGFEVLGR